MSLSKISNSHLHPHRFLFLINVWIVFLEGLVPTWDSLKIISEDLFPGAASPENGSPCSQQTELGAGSRIFQTVEWNGKDTLVLPGGKQRRKADITFSANCLQVPGRTRDSLGKYTIRFWFDCFHFWFWILSQYLLEPTALLGAGREAHGWVRWWSD